jgi:hypothetical protein
MHFIVVSDQDRSRELYRTALARSRSAPRAPKTSGRCHLLALIECFADELEKLIVGNQDHVRVGDSALFSRHCMSVQRQLARRHEILGYKLAVEPVPSARASRKHRSSQAQPPGCLVLCCSMRHGNRPTLGVISTQSPHDFARFGSAFRPARGETRRRSLAPAM